MRSVRYISLFSGMEAASQAFERLGISATPVAFAEIEPVACSVLRHKWPGVQNLGDVSKVDWRAWRGTADVVLGGSPCQSFSIAGHRLGLRDPRGNLALEYLRAVEAIEPRWWIYENVVGLLNSNGGRDFGTFIEAVGDIGHCAAWRVLDARQQGGVPQRRRRVFVVGCAGTDWEAPAEILALCAGQGGDSQAGDEAGEGSTSSAGPGAGSRLKDMLAGEERWRRPARQRLASIHGYDAVVYAADARNGTISDQETMTLTGGHKTGGTSLNTVPCIVEGRQVGVWNGLGVGGGDYAPALTRNGAGDISNYSAVVVERDACTRWTVRRLTPLECIRLQGFDDEWLDGVTHKGKPLSDAQIYKLAGNSWAVPVAAQVIERVANCMSLADMEGDVLIEELAA